MCIRDSYVKRYEEETNLRSHLLLDTSSSMLYKSGSVTKLNYANSLAAAISYLMINQQDAVGITQFSKKIDNTIPPKSKPSHLGIILAQLDDERTENKKSKFAFLDNLKNIKFKKPDFIKNSSVSKSSLPAGEFSKKIGSFFKSKIGKSSVKGEEIVGVELSNKEIRLAQLSSNKSNQWVLDKFYVHPVNLPDDANILDNGEKLGAELTIALQKSKITTMNAAIAIPVTSAIIRVVTAPLMKDEELQKAIETNSLWENLVQLTDNLDDYSIFHQVINRLSLIHI